MTIDAAFFERKANQFLALRISEGSIGLGYHPRGAERPFQNTCFGHPDLPDTRVSDTGSRYGLDNGTPAAHEEVKAIARSLAIALGATDGPDCCEGWFDCLRTVSADYTEDATSTSASKSKVDAYWLHSRVSVLTGSRRRAERPRTRHPVEDRIGEIEDVCTSSARVCRLLMHDVEAVELARATVVKHARTIESEPTAPKEGPFKHRASWLRGILAELKYRSPHYLSRYCAGPDRKTMKKILDGHKVQENVLDRLATCLTTAFRNGRTIERGEIPDS
jgi:hypothetical protein